MTKKKEKKEPKSGFFCKACNAPLSIDKAREHGLIPPPRPEGADLCKEYALERAFGIKRVNGEFV